MKSVLITGCSSGFGLDLVPRFLEEGWRVYITLRQAESRRLLFHQVELRFPGKFEILELDVTHSAQREKVARHFEAQSIGLDCLINNAGYGLFGALEDLGEDQIRKQMEVNFFGLLFMTQRFLPLLRKSKGRIINISSGMGYLGLPLSSLYASSKFAVEGLTESLFYELRPFGVQVCLVEPGQFRTSFGDKSAYGERMADPFSPYFPYSKKFRAWRAARKKRGGTSPKAVVERVVSLASRTRMPLRSRVGSDAHLGFFLKTFLPSCWFHSLLAWALSAGLLRSAAIEEESP